VRIAHVSDLHIRNFKYRDEYHAAFEDLYEQLDALRPDLIVNTGDTVHSKLAVSPELFDDVANHFIQSTNIAPYWVILGNHDLNLKNKGRMDAISPIVRALQGKTSNELRMPQHFQPDVPERFRGGQFREFAFWHYDIRGQRDDFVLRDRDINIGLYHGSISGCVTDIGFIMEDGEAEVSKFDKMDFVLLGDIHKRQSFRGGRIQYPGSLIQQNYGEELVKGFLLWDIRGKDDFSVEFHEVRCPGRFHTIQVPADFDLSQFDIPPKSRIRARLDGELSPSKRLELEKLIASKFDPIEVITPDSSGERESMAELDIEKLVSDRARMMEDHLTEKGCTPEQIRDVRRLFMELESLIDDVGQGRGTVWKLRNVAWDNMMNYGEGNSLDLTKLSGLVGIFAPNASGKSTIFDVMLETLFDKVSKEVPRNIDLINDNKDAGLMTAEFEANGQNYFIERSIERISYGQRKLSEVKQWGKTTLDFAVEGEPLNGTSRPETEKAIRSIIGTFEDFVLTTMVSQNPVFGLPGGGDIIHCKETDRRKILFKFLDLDIYERIHQMCKEELKAMLAGIKGQSREAVEQEISSIDEKLALEQLRDAKLRESIDEAEAEIVRLRSELSQSGIEDLRELELEASTVEQAAAKSRNKLLKASDARAAAERELDKARKTLEKLCAEQPERPSMTMEDVASRLESQRRLKERLRLSIVHHNDEISRAEEAEKILEGIPCEGKYPSCKFISDAVEMKDDRQKLELALEPLRTAWEVTEGVISELNQLEVIHKDIRKWEKSWGDATISVERLTTSLEKSLTAEETAKREHSELESRLEGLRERMLKSSYEAVSALQAELVVKARRLSSLRSDLDEILKLVGSLETLRASKRAEITKLENALRDTKNYELLAELTGKTGLPYRILTRVLPVVNHEIARILTGVTKFSVFFEDDQDTQSVSLYIRYGDYKSRPLGLGSGAEKFIASLAVRCALLSVSSLPKTDILIIDEGFGKLDPEHLEALQRMFEYLKDAFGTVFIISHVDFMRDIVDHSIEITSREGYAHVLVS
jgi:DNA repair exonuclease SbcCD ATPase subunit/DNA repair exonuclease SbcCD nuclease subunit